MTNKAIKLSALAAALSLTACHEAQDPAAVSVKDDRLYPAGHECRTSPEAHLMCRSERVWEDIQVFMEVPKCTMCERERMPLPVHSALTLTLDPSAMATALTLNVPSQPVLVGTQTGGNS